MPVDRYRNKTGRVRTPPRRRSRSPFRKRSRSPPHKSLRTRSPRRDRNPSQSPKRYRSRTRSPERNRRQSSPTRRESRRSDSPPPSKSNPTKERNSSRHSRSRSRSPVKARQSDDRRQRKSSIVEQSPSPTTLDEVLLSEKPLTSSKQKGSIYERYDKYDINVISVHNKGKSKRSQRDIDNDGSAKDFSPSDVIELIHELHPKTSSKKRSKAIFDREEIKDFVEEVVETKVIRLLPSDADMKKLEATFGKDKPSRRRSKEKTTSRHDKKSSKDSKALLRREPEKQRYQVTDADLLGDPQAESSAAAAPYSTSRLESSRAGDSKRSIQDRLGASDRDDKHRRVDERLGRTPEQPAKRDREPRIRSTDLRHNLSSRVSRDSEYAQAPLVRDYGHKSLRTEANIERERTPDFSKRPDKHKIDMMEVDPTFVPRGGRYDQHDDRTRDSEDGPPWWRGSSRGRFGPPRGGFRGGFSYRGDRRDSYSDTRRGPRILDMRNDRVPRRTAVVETWKHDKFSELENELDRKAEPSSTTA